MKNFPWNKDMKDGWSTDFRSWQKNSANAMWDLYWFEESQKQPTDLSPEDIEHCFAHMKDDCCAWIRMATQKTGGYDKKRAPHDLHHDNMARIGMNIIINCCHLAMHNVFGKLPEMIEGDI